MIDSEANTDENLQCNVVFAHVKALACSSLCLSQHFFYSFFGFVYSGSLSSSSCCRIVFMSSYNWPSCWSKQRLEQSTSHSRIKPHDIDIPLILSILVLSIFSSRHCSPSSCCAYICHSVRNPIYADKLGQTTRQRHHFLP